MTNIRLHFVVVLLAVCVSEICGHGRMTDPLNRSSMGASGMYSIVPVNDNPNENFCGGVVVQYGLSGGRCGPCGDKYWDPVPRANENGGVYGKGIIVKEYKAGQKVKVEVELTANHLGYFQFNICELRNKNDVETEECFDKHPLQLIDGNGQIGYKYYPGEEPGRYVIEVFLPEGYSHHCVLRWHYRAGNNWGLCEDGEERTGCAEDAEIFRSCADIAIL